MADEPLPEDDGELGLGLEPFARRPFPFVGRVVQNQILKVEIGGPHEFDRPSTKEEALDRLERTAGPQARQMLEQFLKQVKEVEAKYLEEESTD